MSHMATTNGEVSRPSAAATPGSYCLFQEPWWLDTVAPGRWAEAVVRKGETIVARMPYVATRKYGITAITRPSLTPTLGPWFASTGAKSANRLRAEKDNIGELLAQLPPHRHCSVSCHPEVTNILPFYWAGFHLTVKYTYRVPDLTDLERVWQAFADNIRTDIRKAQKRVGIEHDLGVGSFAETYAKTFRRQGRKPPVPVVFLERLDDVLRQRKQRRIFFAVDAQRRTHAAIYVVWDERCAYYLLGGGDPELRSSGATSLLLWSAIQHASQVSKVFDFEGSMIEPVERFFRAFGAAQTPYYQVTKTNGCMLRLAAALRRAS